MKNKALEENDFSKLPSPVGQTGLGGFIGIISAIFGIGGGTLTVLILNHYGLKIQNAVGTSAACGLPIASAGAIGFLVFGQFADADLKEALPNGVLGFIHKDLPNTPITINSPSGNLTENNVSEVSLRFDKHWGASLCFCIWYTFALPKSLQLSF